MSQQSNAEILKKINELNEIMNINMCKFEQLFNELHVKFDIAINTEPIFQQKNKTDKTSLNKPVSKSIYIKDNIQKDKDIFLNILYTQEEYDKCFEHKDVRKQKTNEDKLKKVADILYKDVINLNDIYKKKATSLHSEFKKLKPEISKDLIEGEEKNNEDEEKKLSVS